MLRRYAIVTLLLLAGTSSGHLWAGESDFVPLFNGKDLTGWHIEKGALFSARDGLLILDGGKGWLRSDKQYKDFELRLDFRFVKGNGDSGIFFRVGPKTKYQVQTNSAFGPKGMGSIRGGKKDDIQARYEDSAIAKVKRPAKEWYSYEIKVQGKRGEVKLNGIPIASADNLVETAGYIGIQAEGWPLEFRNIRIRMLDPK